MQDAWVLHQLPHQPEATKAVPPETSKWVPRPRTELRSGSRELFFQTPASGISKPDLRTTQLLERTAAIAQNRHKARSGNGVPYAPYLSFLVGQPPRRSLARHNCARLSQLAPSRLQLHPFLSQHIPNLSRCRYISSSACASSASPISSSAIGISSSAFGSLLPCPVGLITLC